MNFGAFAGGFAQGWERGTKIGKDMREMIKERGLQEIRESEMSKAEMERQKAASDLIKDTGTTGQPASGPVSTETPKVETPPTDAAAVSAASPTSTVMRSKDTRVAGMSTNISPQGGWRPCITMARANQYTPRNTNPRITAK